MPTVVNCPGQVLPGKGKGGLEYFSRAPPLARVKIPTEQASLPPDPSNDLCWRGTAKPQPFRSSEQMLTLRIAFQVASALAGIAADTTAAARRPQPGLGVLGNQRPFELGDGAKHLQREHALWRGGVDRVAQMRTGSLDDREEMADRAGPAIEPDHDQGFAGADLIQQARQNRPAAICRWRAPRATVAQPAAQFVELRIELRIGALFLSRDPRIANQTAWRGGGFRRFVSMSCPRTRNFYKSIRRP